MLSLAMGVTPPRKLPIAQVDHHCAPRCEPGGWLAQPSDLERWYLGYSQGPETSKWLHYLDIYERHFSRLRGTNATIVEVGINNGGSLAMYRWYFGPRARIVGVDLFNSSFMENNPLYGSPDRMVRGDQQSREFWTWFKQLEPHVDVLIDDGGHQALQQLITFDEMFPHLQPGGILLTEDVMGASFEISNSSKESTRTDIFGKQSWNEYNRIFLFDKLWCKGSRVLVPAALISTIEDVPGPSRELLGENALSKGCTCPFLLPAIILPVRYSLALPRISKRLLVSTMSFEPGVSLYSTVSHKAEAGEKTMTSCVMWLLVC
ncbi:MAG: hypothetical protein SGPRY_003288 [Prymnesium sp.]